MNEIKHIDPKKLANHELLNRLPALAPDDSSVLKVAQSISDLGRIIDPLKITEQGLLVDGRRRRAAALKLKLPQVPCVIVPENEVPALIVAQLEARAHYTKGQRAYLLLPFIQEAFEYARQRRLAGTPTPNELVRNGSKRVEDWANSIGVTYRLLQQAQELRKLFEDHTPRTITDSDDITEEGVSFREFFEPRILREENPYGLGAALTGIKQILDIERKKGIGQAHGGGKPKEAEKQLRLFERTWSDLQNRYEYWSRFDHDQKQHALEAIDKALEAMPPDLLDTFQKRLVIQSRHRRAEMR